MVLGIALFNWDNKAGSILEVKYPGNFEISPNLTNKIYMAHALKEDYTSQELVEIDFNNQIILSLCDKSKVADIGYEILFIIFEEREKVKSYRLKSQLINFSKNLFQKSEVERKQHFLDNVGIFFEKETAKKILITGRAASGKTSIKKIVFEGADPKDLLYNPLDPTRGISPSVYSWLDIKLGLFDSSGQELSDLLENPDDRDHILAFEDTDIVIYLFDYLNWVSNSQRILTDIKRILDIIKDKTYSTKVILFIHKVDLIGKDIRENILKEISDSIIKKFELPIYSTSIFPNLIYTLYNAFYDILSGFSKEHILIKKILDRFLIDHPKTLVFVTNQNDSIIVQTMSKDFNTTIINHSHKLVTQLNNTFEDMALNSQIEHLILSSSQNFNLIMVNLNYQKFNLKNLICISESLSSNKLISLYAQIIQKLKDVYYFAKRLT